MAESSHPDHAPVLDGASGDMGTPVCLPLAGRPWNSLGRDR
jgi:hypothetical protein